jgi:glycosyltransferase involved in cell wall biosynthesis
VGLVFGNMAMGHLYGGLAAMGTETRAVWFQHGVPDDFSGVDFVAARVPSRVIFMYTEAARRAQARFHARAQLVPIPGCVDLARFDPLAVRKGVLRQELGIEPDGLLVACVARLQRWKGQSLFLRAAVLVHASCPRTHFLVVGGTLFGLEQDYARQLEQEGARLLPAGRVHFLGHRPDLPEILADVDVLVHCPVTPEPFGLVVLEAMAMQVPVVATRAGGPMEIVNHGETGTLVPPGDASALAAAVLGLLKNKSNRMAMGGAARRRVHERFSAENMVRQLERHFEQVVLGGSTLRPKWGSS